jgi:hypothetical protein
MLNQDRDLRIREQQASTGWGQAATPGGAVLRRPEPVEERRDPMQQGPVAPVGGMRLVSGYDQVHAQLTNRGVTYKLLEMTDAGEWKCTCFVPSRQNPNVRRRYVATAPTDLAAMQAVLEQIEREN